MGVDSSPPPPTRKETYFIIFLHNVVVTIYKVLRIATAWTDNILAGFWMITCEKLCPDSHIIFGTKTRKLAFTL
jgi:hypothetical protein